MPKFRTSLEDLYDKGEAEIQTKTVEYAEHNGVSCHKLSVLAERGKVYGKAGPPDYVLNKYGYTSLYIEFKKRNGVLSPVQIRYHKRLESRGFKVVIVASIEYGKYWIDKWLAGEVYPLLKRPK